MSIIKNLSTKKEYFYFKKLRRKADKKMSKNDFGSEEWRKWAILRNAADLQVQALER